MKETDRSQYHSGTIAIDLGRDALLQTLSENGPYTEHPTFPGVGVREIHLDSLPEEVRGLIEERRGLPTSFSAVKTQRGIPQHRHTNEGEIYFNGRGGTVSLFDEADALIEKVVFSDGAFTITNPGESHSVTVDPGAEAKFLAVKFSVSSE